jgi:hypothetical protein
MKVLCCAALAAAALSAQPDPLQWFPLHVGSRWVYDLESKSGDRQRPDVDRSTISVTIKRTVTIPEGLVVLRETTSRESQPKVRALVISPSGQPRYTEVPAHAGGYLVGRDSAPYLLHDNCIYLISGGWDATNQSLSSEYREYLKRGSLPADFCFPLEPGRVWGNNDVPWSVEPARAGVGAFLPARFAEAIHIFSNHLGSGGWDDVWFQKGVGVVGEHYIHNGTYDEYTKVLRSYSP